MMLLFRGTPSYNQDWELRDVSILTGQPVGLLTWERLLVQFFRQSRSSLKFPVVQMTFFSEAQQWDLFWESCSEQAALSRLGNRLFLTDCRVGLSGGETLV